MRKVLSTITEEDFDSIIRGLEKLEKILEESQVPEEKKDEDDAKTD
jgi:argininosuccinate lyase